MTKLSSSVRAFVDLPDDARALGPYQCRELLGRGGFAPVFRAVEEHDGQALRDVAVKVFGVDADAGRGPGSFRAKVLDEARALCRVQHPNVVRFFTLHDDPARGLLALVMEYANGRSLGDLLEELPIGDVRRAALTIEVGVAIASALAAAHEAGIVHRDVKPGNILRCDGVFKLIDFGIAAIERPKARRGEPRRVVLDGIPLEVIGTKASYIAQLADDGDGAAELEPISGTFGYIDPVCLRTRGPATTASDLYALGVTLFECLTGAVPAVASARARGIDDLDREMMIGDVPAPAVASCAPLVQPTLAQLIDALLSPTREGRPSSAAAVARELERLRDERGDLSFLVEPTTVQRHRAWIARLAVAGGAVALALAVLGAWSAQRSGAQKRRKALDESWSKLSGCLIGAAPASPDEAARRWRGVQLAVAAADAAASKEGRKSTWPAQCERWADRLHGDLLTYAEGTKSDDLVGRVAALKGRLTTKLPPDEIRALYERANADGLALSASSVDLAPEPVTPLLRPADLATWSAISTHLIPPTALERERNVHPDVDFLITDRNVAGAPMICRWAHPDDRLACSALATSLLGKTERPLLASVRQPGAPALISLGDVGQEGIFRPSGEPITRAGRCARAASRADGSAIAISWPSGWVGAADAVRATLHAVGKAGSTEHEFAPPGTSGDVGNWCDDELVLPEFAAWHAFDRDRKAPRLWTQRLGRGAEELSAPASLLDVGYRERGAGSWATCVNGDTVVIGVRASETSRWVTVKQGPSIDDARSWTTPSAERWGAEDVVACYGGRWSVITNDDKTLRYTRCEFGKCQSETPALPKGDWRAADLEGTLVVVGRPEGDSGVWLHVGHPTELGASTGRLLFDDRFDERPLTTPWVSQVRLHGAGKGALLAIGTSTGLYAARIDASGNVAPASLARPEGR